MKWIKTSDELPPIQDHVLTCRKAEEPDEEIDHYSMSIVSLHRKVKKTGREQWITWHSLEYPRLTEENDRPEWWMPFPVPPNK